MPVALPFSAWQTMTPATAAREVHARVAGLPDALRSAALAWLTPEHELLRELEGVDRGPTDTATSKCEEQERVPSLRGVPYFLKDLFDVAGIPTRAGSTFLDRVRSTPGDSTWVRRLREWGAAFAGKTQLVEFASGLTGENPHYGDCPQPRFPQRLSGGSISALPRSSRTAWSPVQWRVNPQPNAGPREKNELICRLGAARARLCAEDAKGHSQPLSTLSARWARLNCRCAICPPGGGHSR